MTDEKYVFVQDIRDKKITARSSHNRKTHAGKGGSVKFPSDYLTKKELKAMNGEITTYRMNDPMNWKEFNKMPDDIKIMYIKAIQQKYDAPVAEMAKMMGIHFSTLSKEMVRLGINTGKRGHKAWDKEGFYAWCGGVKVDAPENDEPVVETEEPAKTPEPVDARLCGGRLDLMGNVESVLTTLSNVLGNAKVRIRVTWEAVEE